MNFPNDLRYTKSDEWVRLEGGVATAGISDYAQEQLSDIVYVELPAVGKTLKKGDAMGTVESVKASAEVYMPIGGTITEVNTSLADTPEAVNQDPYGKAWMVKFTPSDPNEINDLMDAATYQKYCEERAH